MKLQDAAYKILDLVNEDIPDFVAPDKATLPQVRNVNMYNTVTQKLYSRNLLVKGGYFVVIAGVVYTFSKVGMEWYKTLHEERRKEEIHQAQLKKLKNNEEV